MNELSDIMGSSHQNVKQILLKLEKKDFVSTVPDEKTSESSESLSQINADLFWNRMTITVSRAGTSSGGSLMGLMKKACR